MIVGDVNKAGLQEALKAAGFKGVVQRDNVLVSCDPAEENAINAFIAEYDELPEARLEVTAAIRAEGLARAQTLFPSIKDFAEIELIVEQHLSIVIDARQPTAKLTKLIAFVQAVDAAVALIESAALADVKAFNAVTGPAWAV